MRKERKVRSGKVINSRLVKEGWYSRDPPQISLIHQTELSVRHCFTLGPAAKILGRDQSSCWGIFMSFVMGKEDSRCSTIVA